jgi:hypothetical protein
MECVSEIFSSVGAETPACAGKQTGAHRVASGWPVSFASTRRSLPTSW